MSGGLSAVSGDTEAVLWDVLSFVRAVFVGVFDVPGPVGCSELCL